MNSKSPRIALITGAYGHIGSAIVKELTDINFNCVCLDHPSCHQIFHCDIQNTHLVHPLMCDLSRLEDLSGLASSIPFSSLDLLVNNAAYYGDVKGFDAPFLEESINAWSEVFKVNTFAPFFLAQAFHHNLLSSPDPSIINIGSMYTEIGPNPSLYFETEMNNPCSYTASKSALVGITQWLSTVLAPKIRVNSISPGGLERSQPKVFQDRYCLRTPLKRFCTPNDVAKLVVFLASESSSYITGQNLLVDGGFTRW